MSVTRPSLLITNNTVLYHYDAQLREDYNIELTLLHVYEQQSRISKKCGYNPEGHSFDTWELAWM